MVRLLSDHPERSCTKQKENRNTNIINSYNVVVISKKTKEGSEERKFSCEPQGLSEGSFQIRVEPQNPQCSGCNTTVAFAIRNTKIYRPTMTIIHQNDASFFGYKI